MENFDQNKRLAAIRTSISEMDDDELREIIGISRNNRAATPQKRKRKKSSKGDSITKLLEDMSPEEAAELLSKLTNDE